MNPKPAFYFPVVYVGMAVLLGTVAGCNQETPSLSVAEYNKTNIVRLRNAYSLVQTSNGVGPADEEDFKSFLRNDPATKIRLGRMGVTPEMIDGIFVSERDGKPFKVRYGLKASGNDAIVFEVEGVNGKRMVAFYEPRELDNSEYENYWSGKLKAEAFKDGLQAGK